MSDWNFSSGSNPFQSFMYRVRCQNAKCGKYVRINIMREVYIEFGFACPHCNRVTNSDLMLSSMMANHGGVDPPN